MPAPPSGTGECRLDDVSLFDTRRTAQTSYGTTTAEVAAWARSHLRWAVRRRFRGSIDRRHRATWYRVVSPTVGKTSPTTSERVDGINNNMAIQPQSILFPDYKDPASGDPATESRGGSQSML
ncbi:uncharacterized protein PG998_004304 [Apiospora kogelbergensis]|uniref:uncharacterized protein n=1 Tax=Apiospora kogelbergensis TaxID=1337665 RepID=UPI00313086D8